MRKTLIPAMAVAGFALLLPAQPALAVSKEIIQLQTQVQGLQDMLQQMQRANSEQMGVLQNLIQQSNDNVNRMTQQMTALQAKVEAEGQNTQLSGQIQSLSDSVDELKSRLNRINASLTSIQNQMQNVAAPPTGTAAAGATPAGAMPSGSPTAAAPPQQPSNGEDTQPAPQQPAPAAQPGGTNVPLNGQDNTQPAPGMPQTTPQGGPPQGESQAPPQAQVPPVAQLYQSAFSDYEGAHYDLATSEFAEVIKYYPESSQAGNASFYLGEVAYRQGLYPAAIKNYDIVLDQYPASPKAPAARLRKGEAELASDQRNAGIRDLRELVARYPMSPEGAQGRSLLNGMGVRLTANKPSPYQTQ